MLLGKHGEYWASGCMNTDSANQQLSNLYINTEAVYSGNLYVSEEFDSITGGKTTINQAFCD
jgi:hypothetical protein